MMATELNVGDRAVYRKHSSLDAPLEPGDAAFDTNTNRIVSINGENPLCDFKDGEEVRTKNTASAQFLYDGAISCWNRIYY